MERKKEMFNDGNRPIHSCIERSEMYIFKNRKKNILLVLKDIISDKLLLPSSKINIFKPYDAMILAINTTYNQLNTKVRNTKEINKHPYIIDLFDVYGDWNSIPEHIRIGEPIVTKTYSFCSDFVSIKNPIKKIGIHELTPLEISIDDYIKYVNEEINNTIPFDLYSKYRYINIKSTLIKLKEM